MQKIEGGSVKRVGLFCLNLCVFILLSVNVFAGDDTVLAKVGDTRITLSDLNRIIGHYTPEQQEIISNSPENKVRLLKKLVQEKVLAADAKKLGIDKDPGVREQIEILTNNQLASELLKREVADKISVSDDEARIYYQLHKDDFKTPETVRVRHILVKVDKDAGEEAKKTAKEKALSLLTRIRGGENFEKIAEESSDDAASRPKGGDLGFFPKGKMVPEFEKASFGLKPGEVSDIVETKYGYHIIKCEEKRAAGFIPFENARKGIIERITKETTASKIKEYVEKRMAEEKAEIFFERLMK